MYVFICEICICVLPSVLHTAILRSEFLESVFYAYSTGLKWLVAPFARSNAM